MANGDMFHGQHVRRFDLRLCNDSGMIELGNNSVIKF